MTSIHNFHIPVMGIAYTIDTPLKVSQYGIDSVISLVDDILLEKLRKVYCEKYNLIYQEISDKVEDFRAKRISSYLNLLQKLAEEKFENLKSASKEHRNKLNDYFQMLSDTSSLKKDFKKFTSLSTKKSVLRKWLNENLRMGSIDVNIMTKIDKENYKNGEKLDSIYNDAHAALRGFAQSDLRSSVILSAGLNPRLYSYIAEFDDFYPDGNNQIKKKVVIKVSDYRSALIQGKFLAKKGIWVSEYRIESGLNCGGHAFATEGFLLGPILSEFKQNRKDLIDSVFELFKAALSSKGRRIPKQKLDLKISVQGGVGTHEEHEFLINHYQVDSVGWGSPFLLVPEATTVDSITLTKLKEAKENDLYLSQISPLGVPFNNLRGNTKDSEKEAKILKEKPGSSCPKRYVALNKEYNEEGMCTASRQYQHLKLKELKSLELSAEEFQKRQDKIVEKSCICVGLGTAALIENNIDTKREGEGVSICPGPNMAYFSKELSLKEMTEHIQGRRNVIARNDRPNMFIKELSMYISYLTNKVFESSIISKKEKAYLERFSEHLSEGIRYYLHLFASTKQLLIETKKSVLEDLKNSEILLKNLKNEIQGISLV